MNKLFVTLVLVSILMLLASNGFSEISAGDNEIGGQISYRNHNADPGSLDATLWSAGIAYNHYLSESYSIGGTLRLDQVDGDALDDDVVIWGLRVRGDYYFSTQSTTVPYVGIQLGYVGYDTAGSDDNDFTYGAHGGVKLFVTENVAINLEAIYDIFEIESTDIDSFSLLA